MSQIDDTTKVLGRFWTMFQHANQEAKAIQNGKKLQKQFEKCKKNNPEYLTNFFREVLNPIFPLAEKRQLVKEMGI